MNATIISPSGEQWHETTERSGRDTPKGRIEAVVCETRYTKEVGGITTTNPDKFAVVIETTRPGEKTQRTWRPVDSIKAGTFLIHDQFSRIP